MPRYHRFLLALLLLLATADQAAAQCAMCKAVATDAAGKLGGDQTIGAGLNHGILYLMAVPYLLIFVVFRKKIVAFFKEFANAQG